MTESAQLQRQDPAASSPPSPRKRGRSSKQPQPHHEHGSQPPSPSHLRRGRHHPRHQSHYHHQQQLQEEDPHHQPSFTRLAQTISHSWGELNVYLQMPSLSIAKLHLETLALMRGLHCNHQRPIDKVEATKASSEREAAKARLLALETHLAGIRDNLSQVLATSHLMMQAAGDIDSELDSIARFTNQDSFSEALAGTTASRAAPQHPNRPEGLKRQRSSSSTPSLQAEDGYSTDGEEIRPITQGPLQHRQRRRLSGRALAESAMNQVPHSRGARTDYFDHWEEAAKSKTDAPHVKDGAARKAPVAPEASPYPQSRAHPSSFGPKEMCSLSVSDCRPEERRALSLTTVDLDANQDIATPPLLKIEKPATPIDSGIQHLSSPYHQRWARLQASPLVDCFPAT